MSQPMQYYCIQKWYHEKGDDEGKSRINLTSNQRKGMIF